MSVACNLNCVFVSALSAGSDTSFVISAVTHSGRTACTYPVVTAVVSFFLLLDTLVEYSYELIKVTEEVIKHSLVIDILDLDILAEPLPEFLRQILLRSHVFEIFCKDHIKFIVFCFGFNQNTSAQLIEFHKRALRKTLVQSLNQQHPFVYGNIDTSCP